MKDINLIKEKRIEKGMTQQQLANILGLARSTIASYEIGVSKPKGKTAVRISKILDIPLEKLIV